MQTNKEDSLKLSLTQKMRLRLFGITPTEKKILSGWRGDIQFYAFTCPKHGVVEDYPHGYRQILRCRKCQTKIM